MSYPTRVMGGVRIFGASLVVGGLAFGCAASESTANAPAPSAPSAVDRRAAQVQALIGEGRRLSVPGHYAEAEAPLRQAVKLGYGFSEPWRSYRAEALSILARSLLAQHRPTDARDAVDQGLTLTSPGSVIDDQRIAQLQLTRAEAFKAEDAALASVQPYSDAIEATARHRELSLHCAILSIELARTLETLGRHQTATKTLERALTIATATPDSAARAPEIASLLAGIYEQTGDPRRARDLRAQYLNQSAAAAPDPAKAGSDKPTPPENAGQQVASMQADFRACFRASLADDYDLAGKVSLTLRLAPDGHVAEVKANAPSLPRATVECLVRRATIARFDPPGDGNPVLTVPVQFVKQD